MKKRHWLSSIILVSFLITTLTGFVQCRGGECAASMSPDVDLDSDCIADSADNCPFKYNPQQIDTDGDGNGDACIGDSLLVDDKVFQQAHLSKNQRGLISCQSFEIIACQNEYIGEISYNEKSKAYSYTPEWNFLGLEKSPYSLWNTKSFLISEKSHCSAFSENAAHPPVVICTETSEAFYLSENNQIENSVDPCSFFENVGLDHPYCE